MGFHGAAVLEGIGMFTLSGGCGLFRLKLSCRVVMQGQLSFACAIVGSVLVLCGLVAAVEAPKQQVHNGLMTRVTPGRLGAKVPHW